MEVNKQFEEGFKDFFMFGEEIYKLDTEGNATRIHPTSEEALKVKEQCQQESKNYLNPKDVVSKFKSLSRSTNKRKEKHGK